MPRPHDSDDHAFEVRRYDAVTQISTDGLAAYPEAVDLAFGPYANYGVLIKEYRNRDLPNSYAPAEMIGTKRILHQGLEKAYQFSICTSHIERQNLTVRTFMKRFNRLALAFSKKLENLEAAVAMYVAYYNFVWRTRHADDSGMAGRKRPTAAMMAKVTDHLWSSTTRLFSTGEVWQSNSHQNLSVRNAGPLGWNGERSEGYRRFFVLRKRFFFG